MIVKASKVKCLKGVGSLLSEAGATPYASIR
jgi:hypothetical protein